MFLPGSADTARYVADRAEDLRRSKLALDGVFNGPDGMQGTKDDFDAILHLGNANANVTGEGRLSERRSAGRLQCAVDADACRSADRRAVPVRHHVRGAGVLGAEADRAGVRVRAGDEASRAAREHAAAAERRHSRAGTETEDSRQDAKIAKVQIPLGVLAILREIPSQNLKFTRFTGSDQRGSVKVTCRYRPVRTRWSLRAAHPRTARRWRGLDPPGRRPSRTRRLRRRRRTSSRAAGTLRATPSCR